MNGASLSTAAHAAGFADSAHLARTSRRMIGIPPSLMDVSDNPASPEHAGFLEPRAPQIVAPFRLRAATGLPVTGDRSPAPSPASH